jgi:hypothetical protein
MRIVITKDDIHNSALQAQGKRDFLERGCPIAQALKRRNLPFDAVLRDSIKWKDGTETELPDDAKEFIRRFDRATYVGRIEMAKRVAFELP